MILNSVNEISNSIDEKLIEELKNLKIIFRIQYYSVIVQNLISYVIPIEEK